MSGMQWNDLPNRSARFNDLMRQTYQLLDAAAKLQANVPLAQDEADEVTWIAIRLCDIERAMREEAPNGDV